MGCANQAGEDNRNVARMSLLLAGLPYTVPGETVNRLCSSGLSATIVLIVLSKLVMDTFL
jgi:acetyl-CoA acetyltransferase